MRCHWILFTVASLVAILPARAQPAPPDAGTDQVPTPEPPQAYHETPETLEQAKTYYEAGHQAFINARYTVAIAAFSQALSLAPSRASVRLALGESYRYQYFIDTDGAKAQRALDLLREYVAAVNEGKERETAVRYIAELTPVVERYKAERLAEAPVKPKTQFMVASLTPNAFAQVDGGARSTIPLLVETSAGKHAVHLEAEGFFAEDTEGVAVDGQLVVVERQLRARPGSVQVIAPPGSTVSVDDNVVGTAPVAPISVSAGAHTLVVRERGHVPYVRDLQVGRAEVVSVRADLPPTSQRHASFLVAAAALALAAGGGIETLLALSARSDANALSAQRAMSNLTPDQLVQQNQRVDDFHSDTTASYYLYGGAAAVLATSVLLYFLDQPSVETRVQPATILAPGATSDGRLTLTLLRRF